MSAILCCPGEGLSGWNVICDSTAAIISRAFLNSLPSRVSRTSPVILKRTRSLNWWAPQGHHFSILTKPVFFFCSPWKANQQAQVRDRENVIIGVTSSSLLLLLLYLIRDFLGISVLFSSWPLKDFLVLFQRLSRSWYIFNLPLN